MKITILTLFPDFFASALHSSMLARAQQAEQVKYDLVNIRDYASGKHAVTDDRPYGGGAGMVMMVEPIDAALKNLGFTKGVSDSRIVLTSAKGEAYTQSHAVTFSKLKDLVIICGHYEGVDERVAEYLIDEELRIGDYVLTGGEPAALVIADSVTRLLPDVLGNPESNQGESHQVPGQFGYPQYTRPENYRGWEVPSLLLSGNHAAIEGWREDHRPQPKAKPKVKIAR